jgi:hypothetical protein
MGADRLSGIGCGIIQSARSPLYSRIWVGIEEVKLKDVEGSMQIVPRPLEMWGESQRSLTRSRTFLQRFI